MSCPATQNPYPLDPAASRWWSLPVLSLGGPAMRVSRRELLLATDTSPVWPGHSPAGQPGETQPTAGVGDPRLPAPAVFHAAAVSGGGDVPLVPDRGGDVGRHSAVAGVDHPPATARRTDEKEFDTAHAAELYPELAGLEGWTWWWVGGATDAQLVGYHHHATTAMDMLYIDSDEHAAITRVRPSGELYVHQSGRLVEVLAVLTNGGEPR